MRDISIKTTEALGQAVRSRRLAKHLSQAALAERMGVERKWVVRLEAGNHAAEIGNVLKALQILELDVKLFVSGEPLPTNTPTLTPRASDVLARVVSSHKAEYSDSEPDQENDGPSRDR
jgi:transcriptional regulator with XRE-family HTH domain